MNFPKTYAGATLIEVLISFFILTILLLGVDAMQWSALRAAKSAYYFAVATQQLDVMLEQLSVRGEKKDSEWLTLWNQQNNQVLPQGYGEIQGAYPHFNVTIYWGEKKFKPCTNQIGQSGCLSVAVTF